MRFALVVLLVCALTGVSRADELDTISQASPVSRGPSAAIDLTPLPPPVPAPHPRRSYALVSIAVDLALVATFQPVVESGGDDMVAVYGLAWLAAGPVVHGLEGNQGEVGLSLLRRLLLPIGGGLVGAGLAGRASTCEEDCWDTLVGAVIGTGVGAIVATVIDWTRSRI